MLLEIILFWTCLHDLLMILRFGGLKQPVSVSLCHLSYFVNKKGKKKKLEAEKSKRKKNPANEKESRGRCQFDCPSRSDKISESEVDFVMCQ